MRTDKQRGLKMRLEGKSYNEIRSQLGIPKSTLSGWFSGLDLPDDARRRLSNRIYEKSISGLLKRNKNQAHLAVQRAHEIRELAKKELPHVNKEGLALIGISLYWAEGYKRPIIRNGKTKTHHPVSLTNSDPFLVKVFLRFLREVCAVEESKIRAGLRIYEHQNEGHLLEFWSRITEISPAKFEKFYYGVSKSSQGKRPYNILPYGTIQIRVNSTNLYHRIMGWIEGLSKL